MKYKRILIKTHFITTSDNLESIISKYVLPAAENNDLVVFCEKIISIIQGRVVYKKDLKLGFWAKFLSKLVKKTPYGFGVRNPYKMQVAINLAGLPRILLACLCSGGARIVGIKGIFYKVVGHQINQIDGFYGQAFSQYAEMGILGSKDSNKLCQELKDKFGFSFAVADVNDLGRNIIGTSSDLKGREKEILDALADNPAGQSNQQTPIVILRS